MGRRDIINKYRLLENYAELIILSNKYGEFNILLDLDDLEKIQHYNWNINKFGHKKDIFYTVSREVGLLHRYIMSVTDRKKQVDHINGDTYDNRKINLRIVDQKDNLKNKGLYVPNKSGYPGVYWYDYCPTPRWIAHITINKKRKHLGSFEKLEDAIQARKDAEYLFGEFKREDPLKDYNNN